MNWDMQDGVHEGWPAAVAPDGRITNDVRTGSVSVEGVSGSFTRHPVNTGRELVPDDKVIGWRSFCACGWTGPFWKRVLTASQEMREKHLAFVPFLGVAVPSVAVEKDMHLEWLTHAKPAAAISELKAALREYKVAEKRIARGVHSARSAGVSWATIGATLGISKQSAHERWKGTT